MLPATPSERDACARHPTAVPGAHLRHLFSGTASHGHVSLSPQACDSRGGDQVAKRVMRASLLFASQHKSPLHPCWDDQHAVLSPPYKEMLQGRPPCSQPACSQSRSVLRGHFGQHVHALQWGLARPAAKGRKSVLVKHHIWSGATSTKHRDAPLFQRVLPLRRRKGLG